MQLGLSARTRKELARYVFAYVAQFSKTFDYCKDVKHCSRTGRFSFLTVFVYFFNFSPLDWTGFIDLFYVLFSPNLEL